jgi:hypothetical protein
MVVGMWGHNVRRSIALGGLAMISLWIFVVLPIISRTPIEDKAVTLLEEFYYFSQIGLFFIAVGAAIVGYLQLRASNRYELLKKLEDEQVRKARRKLFHEVYEKKLQGLWWDENPDPEEAAATVCAAYDIVALMAKYGNLREWAYPICKCIESLLCE